MPHESPNLKTDRPSRLSVTGKLAARAGMALILLSGVFWFSLFAVPFLPLTIAQKAGLAGALFIGVQVAWWTGATLAGPQAIARLWSWLGRRKKTDES